MHTLRVAQIDQSSNNRPEADCTSIRGLCTWYHLERKLSAQAASIAMLYAKQHVAP